MPQALFFLSQSSQQPYKVESVVTPILWMRNDKHGEIIENLATQHGFPWSLQMAKSLPAMQETQVWPLGWEDPLEEGMATHSSILAWRIPRTEEPGRLQSVGSQRVRHDWTSNTWYFLFTFGHTASQWLSRGWNLRRVAADSVPSTSYPAAKSHRGWRQLEMPVVPTMGMLVERMAGCIWR